jgi:multidrug efflux system membrane fusion protein
MAMLILSACSSQSSNQAAFNFPAVAVLSTEGKVEDVPVYLEAVGTLKASAIVEVRPQVNGMLKEVHFDEGQDVKAGDKLFTVDSEPYLIKVQEVEAQHEQNKAALLSAKKKLDRFSTLSKKDLISQQEWDDLECQVMKGQAVVKGDEAKLAAASRDLNHCIIRAPMDGKLGKMTYHPGNLVSASQSTPLVVLYNCDKLVVEFKLTEKEFQQLTDDHLRGDHPIEICSYCPNSESSQGTLTFLNNTFDADTGLLQIQGRFKNEDQRYLPGQTVKVKFPLATLKDRLLVPQKAVKINQKGPYVFLIKDDETVELRQVTLGEEFGDKVIILEGLLPGEKIVSEGHLRLAPGLKVSIKDEASES